MRSLSLRLRVAIYSQSLTWPLEGVSRHFCAGKPKSQILAPERELSLPWLREESILSWLGINTLNNISSTFYLMVTLSPRSYLQSLTSFFCFLTHLTPWPTLSLHQHIYCPSLTHLNPLTLLSPNQPKYKKLLLIMLHHDSIGLVIFWMERKKGSDSWPRKKDPTTLKELDDDYF